MTSVPLEADEALTAKSVSSRFTVWRVPPIIPASSDWVNGQAGRIAPSGSASRRHPHEARRQASREIQEVELLDMAGEPAQLGDETREERAPELGVLVDEPFEGLPAEHERLGRLQATAVAECGAPSRSASSPKKSPAPRVAMIAPSSPSGTAGRSSPRRSR